MFVHMCMNTIWMHDKTFTIIVPQYMNITTKFSTLKLLLWWSPNVPNKYKTFIQSGCGTKNQRKRFTLPGHSLKNYEPLNSQTTGKFQNSKIKKK
jgi:hypothetical protein